MASQKAVKTITTAIQRLYPRELADNSWDNTGLILGAATGSDGGQEAAKEPISVLLAIDLTTAVCDEALKKKCSMIMAYHPFIFRGLKSVTPEDPQQKSLLKLVKAGISVYCPHTAVDAAVGGVNDWLVDVLAQKDESDRYSIEPTSAGIEGHEKGGMGRVVNLANPLSVEEIVKRTKSALNLKHVQVALSSKHREGGLVNSIAICAGSGGSVLRGSSADLHFTGELGHHELLYLTETGKSAIICGHSNTERGFLSTFKKQLAQQLSADHDGPVSVEISETDRDPLETV